MYIRLYFVLEIAHGILLVAVETRVNGNKPLRTVVLV